MNLKRAIEMDARLAAAGASPQPVPEERQGDAPSVEEQQSALALLEDWRRNREQREGPPAEPEAEAQS